MTEAVEYFENDLQFKIDKIVIIAPENSEIRDNGVDDILRCFYGNRIEDHYVEGISDVKSDDDLKQFLKVASRVIREYRKDEYEILLNFAGGRKSMSAAMVRLAQLGHIDQAFHVLINDPELEEWCTENGTIDALMQRKKKFERGLSDRKSWDAPLFPGLDKLDIVLVSTINKRD